EEQEAIWLERVMEDRDDVTLQLAVEIDEEIAARDQVHARERRIAHHAVRREHAHVADRLVDDVAGALGTEEAPEPLLRHALQQSVGVAAAGRYPEARRVGYGGRGVGFLRVIGSSRLARAAGSRANRPPRRWRSPAPTPGSCPRGSCLRTSAASPALPTPRTPWHRGKN